MPFFLGFFFFFFFFGGGDRGEWARLADYLALQVVVSTQLIVNGPTYYLSDTKDGL